MPGIVSEDFPESEGRAASMEFGRATKMDALVRQGGAKAFGPPPGLDGGGGRPPEGGQPAPEGDAGPSQPPLPDPHAIVQNGKVDMAKAFTTPMLNRAPQAWRQQWQTLAAHPAAGPWIKQMAKMAHVDQPQRPQ